MDYNSDESNSNVLKNEKDLSFVFAPLLLQKLFSESRAVDSNLILNDREEPLLIDCTVHVAQAFLNQVAGGLEKLRLEVSQQSDASCDSENFPVEEVTIQNA